MLFDLLLKKLTSILIIFLTPFVMKNFSKCGVCCSVDCKAYKIECDGCNELAGKVAWAKFYGKILCPIYECAELKGFLSCKEC